MAAHFIAGPDGHARRLPLYHQIADIEDRQDAGVICFESDIPQIAKARTARPVSTARPPWECPPAAIFGVTAP